MTEAEGYVQTGLTEQGPGLFYGIFLLALAILPAVLLDDQPWKAIAVVNAITHVVTGFAWTITPTRFSRVFRQLGVNIWLLTVILSQLLIVVLIVLALT